ncbi:hypothetical protein B0H16DRAFT_1468090 [Mycena metata]|uniref:Uncharacterized protein n=1 Tax=Mycena metata TaxID=1033252 RepID=A0AAD7I3A6_9AGAR|nr:hypothetical protein B0H16DRAFT_1468090 [Mycena metata]
MSGDTADFGGFRGISRANVQNGPSLSSPSTVHSSMFTVQRSEIPPVHQPDLVAVQRHDLAAVQGPEVFPVQPDPPRQLERSLTVQPLSDLAGSRTENTAVQSSHCVCSKELELWYQFVGLCGISEASSSGMLVVSCHDVSAFVTSYRFLSAKDTRALAERHALGTRGSSRQDLHRDALRNHKCNVACPALEILYINEDGLPEPGAIRSFELNQYFQFLRCGPRDDLSRFSHRNYVICHTDTVSRFVSMYNPLTVKHLRALTQQLFTLQTIVETSSRAVQCAPNTAPYNNKTLERKSESNWLHKGRRPTVCSILKTGVGKVTEHWDPPDTLLNNSKYRQEVPGMPGGPL